MKRPAKDATAAPAASVKKNPAGLRKSARRLILVRFEFTPPEVITVSVAGSFNNWHPTTKSKHPLDSGYWSLEAFLAPADYKYPLTVDDHRMPGPGQRPNPFGGRNSVLHVAELPEAAHRNAAHHVPLKTSKPVRNQKL